MKADECSSTEEEKRYACGSQQSQSKPAPPKAVKSRAKVVALNPKTIQAEEQEVYEPYELMDDHNMEVYESVDS